MEEDVGADLDFSKYETDSIMRAALMRAIYGPPFIERAERELRSAAVKDTLWLSCWGASVDEEARDEPRAGARARSRSSLAQARRPTR